jgi:drug/metabolite transporter (DMT)-like permease
MSRSPIAYALTAAVLFGSSTPAAKALLAGADPWWVAGLLYLGSGVGLALVRVCSRLAGRASREAPLRRRDVPWLVGAIAVGGGVAPVLLMVGLAAGSASQVSLLLNLEGVLTAGLAWLVFREHVDRRIALGMLAITAGAVVLAWQPGHGWPVGRSALFVAGACLAWAVDNNLTRRISGGDPVAIAALKGGAAGVANLAIAAAAGVPAPGASSALATALVGFVGYGVSLALFVRALRDLGTARTGAYFSVAPFVGALGSVIALGEAVTPRLALGGALMAWGVWLHLSEHHAHEHVHEALAHEHLHRHDGHHGHAHDAPTSPGEPHSHPHVHATIPHAHPHYPDLHHRHLH